MSFDKIFSIVNKMNENRFGPGKAKVISDGNKIVANPIDRNSFTVKAVGYQDMIVQGRLTLAGFNGILNWLKQQPDIIDYYYKLNDLKNNFVAYEIVKDKDALDKQVFKFTVVERGTVPTLNPAVNYVSLEELQSIQKGIGPKELVVSQSQQLLGKQGVDPVKATGLTFPIVAASIPGNKNTNLVNFIRDAYLKVKQDPNVSSYAGLAAVKAEVNKGELGKSSQAFVYALNSAFGIKDWSGEEVETNLTAALATKLYAAPTATAESASYFLHPNGRQLIKEDIDALPGFSSNAFIAGFDQALKGLGGGPTNTGGIVVPAEGFKYDSTFKLKNAELQKFQEILMKNLPTYAGGALKSKPPVAAFLRTKADGIYGNKTRDLVGYLKIGLTDPKYPDNDNSTIKADFVNRMLKEFKVVQENKTYIGLDGYSIVIEGFDTGAADTGSGVSSGSSTPKKKASVPVNNGTPPASSSSSSSNASSKIKQLQTNTVYEYFVKNGVWHYRKRGSKDAGNVVTTPASIKALITNYFNELKDGYFIHLKKQNDGSFKRDDDRLYRFANKKWEVKISGAWQTVENATPLNQVYGTSPVGSPKSSGSTNAMSAKDIFAKQKAIAVQIKGWWEGSEFSDYVGAVYDDPEGAWSHFVNDLWPPIEKKLNTYRDAIILLSDENQKTILNNNNARLREIKTGAGKGRTNSLTFKEKVMNSFGTTNDIYSIELKDPTTGSNATINVDVDFG